MSEYLKNTCKTKDGNMFWNVVRPLISDKAKSGQETIVLNDNGHILNEPQEFSNVFNKCFNYIATSVGDDAGFNNVYGIEDVDLKEYLSAVLSEYKSHPSVVNIRTHYSNVNHGNQGFSFNSVELHDVEKKLRTLKVCKSSGYE